VTCGATDRARGALNRRAILSDGNASLGDFFFDWRRLMPVENGAKHRFRSRLEKGLGSEINNQPEEKHVESDVTVLMGRLVRAPVIRNNGSKMGFFTSPAIVATATKRRSPGRNRVCRVQVYWRLDRRAGASARRETWSWWRAACALKPGNQPSTVPLNHDSRVYAPKSNLRAPGMPAAFLSASLTDVTKTARQWDAVFAMRVHPELLGKYTAAECCR